MPFLDHLRAALTRFAHHFAGPSSGSPSDADAPGDVLRTVRIALEARALCEEIGLPSLVKTSGGSGLHILLPLGRQCDHEQSRQLAAHMPFPSSPP